MCFCCNCNNTTSVNPIVPSSQPPTPPVMQREVSVVISVLSTNSPLAPPSTPVIRPQRTPLIIVATNGTTVELHDLPGLYLGPREEPFEPQNPVASKYSDSSGQPSLGSSANAIPSQMRIGQRPSQGIEIEFPVDFTDIQLPPSAVISRPQPTTVSEKVKDVGIKALNT